MTARVAGIDTPVTIETTAGGVPVLETYPKYALIHTHTARRTAATQPSESGRTAMKKC